MANNILAVDDEADILRLVADSLKSAGYIVSTAGTGSEALEAIAQTKPDLIVLDVVMPEMDGFQVLEHLRQDPVTAAIPVVLLTGTDLDSEVLSGRLTWDQIGSNLYLSKPFEPDTLIHAVQQMLGDQ